MCVRRFGPTLAALVAPVLLLSLAACTEDPIAPEPVTPSSPAESASPSTEASKDPLAVETPQEFLRRWVEALNRMTATGETSAFLELGHGCRSCARSADLMGGIYRRGGWVRTDGWTLVKVIKVDQTRGPAVRIEFLISSASSTFKKSRRAETQTLEGGRVRYELTLRSLAAGWRATGLSQVAQ
ncbi:exported hypothetical protein [metagenome]|uniref:DUF6318 domain-containing protein n=1 Tax=metagenome TaxID=256318 RepID=A0A2P2C881_9ZZZZ